MTRTIIVILISLLAFVCVTSMSIPPPSSKQSNNGVKVGVIGGGPAGLFAARELVRLGYKHVVVFEKTNASGLVNSQIIDGKMQDYTTRFVPSVTALNGPGVFPPLKEMIDEFNLQLQPSSSPLSYVDISTGVPYPVPAPHIFAPYFAAGGLGAAAIVSDLVWGYEVLRQVSAAEGNRSVCLSTLSVSSGTTFSAWASTVNKPAFTNLATFSNDVFLGGVSTDQDVCYFLNVRSYFLPGDICAVLRSFQVPNTTSITISDSLRSCLNVNVDVRRLQFTTGYNSFFNAIRTNTEVEVLHNVEVVDVTRQNDNKLRVTLSTNHEHNFDKLVIATRPQDAVPILNNVATQAKGLLALATSSPKFVMSFRTAGTSPNVFTSVLYPKAVFAGTSNITAGVYGLNKEYSDSSVVTAIGYSSGTAGADETASRASISAMGYTATDVVFSQQYQYPAKVPATQVANGWFEQMENLQGVDDIVFVGEVLAGYGIPPILQHTNRIINAHF